MELLAVRAPVQHQRPADGEVGARRARWRARRRATAGGGGAARAARRRPRLAAAASRTTEGPNTTPKARAASRTGTGAVDGEHQRTSFATAWQERAHDDRDAGADDAPVAQEVRARVGVERLRPGLVGDQRARAPVGAQRDAAGDLREPGLVEGDEVGGVDRLPDRLAAPEAADHAEGELPRRVVGELDPLAVLGHVAEPHRPVRLLAWARAGRAAR